MTGNAFQGFACALLGHKPVNRIRYERHGVMLISRYKLTVCKRCGRIITNSGRK